MNKSEIIALLLAAGIACDESMTVAALKELAAANNVSLVKEKPAEVDPLNPVVEFEASAEEDPDAAEIAEKVRAGLTAAQAREVIARQRAEDKAAAKAAK